MELIPLGDAAFILRNLEGRPAFLVAQAIRAANFPGVKDVNSAFDSVGVYGEPGELDGRACLEVAQACAVGEFKSGVVHRIPVCYTRGEDLLEVAEELGWQTQDVVAAHTCRAYLCQAVGFAPGFGYLGPTQEEFWPIGRKQTPRRSVPQGSVALAGKQTAVYPQATPGGWRLIGQTPLVLVDIETDYFPISAGDEVEFFAIDESEFLRREGERL